MAFSRLPCGQFWPGIARSPGNVEGKKWRGGCLFPITVWEISLLFFRQVRSANPLGADASQPSVRCRVCGFVALPVSLVMNGNVFITCRVARAFSRLRTPYTFLNTQGQSSWLPLSPPTSSLASTPSSSACAREDGEAISGTIRSHRRAPRRERFSFRRVRPERAPRDLARRSPARAIPGTSG